MIVYFSATGNSAYVANRIGNELKDDVIDLFERIKQHDYSDLHAERPWVLVCPTYAWRIPRVVHEWLEKTRLIGNKEIYFVMTCAGSIGNAGKYLKTLSASKLMKYRGCYPIIMPENYIALFGTPSKEKAGDIISQAEGEIDNMIHLLQQGKHFPPLTLSVKDKMSSGVVNALFYPMFVHAKKFYARDTCTTCGICSKVCPLSNIRIEDSKPVWGKSCTHCMACINRCPVEAIEYGSHSKDLVRYTFPRQNETNQNAEPSSKEELDT